MLNQAEELDRHKNNIAKEKVIFKANQAPNLSEN